MPTVDDLHLERILDRVQEWARAADTKAEILGLMQTASAALLADNFASWFAPGTSGFLRAGLSLAIAFWVFSVAMTALVILAKTDNPYRTSVTFFGDIASKKKYADQDAYRAALNNSALDIRNDYIDQIYVCSLICGDKHRYLKYGIRTFLGSAVVLVLVLAINGALR